MASQGPLKGRSWGPERGLRSEPLGQSFNLGHFLSGDQTHTHSKLAMGASKDRFIWNPLPDVFATGMMSRLMLPRSVQASLAQILQVEEKKERIKLLTVSAVFWRAAITASHICCANV